MVVYYFLKIGQDPLLLVCVLKGHLKLHNLIFLLESLFKIVVFPTCLGPQTKITGKDL